VAVLRVTAVVAVAALVGCQRETPRRGAPASVRVRVTDGVGGPPIAARVLFWDGDRPLPMGRLDLYNGARQAKGACELGPRAIGTAGGVLLPDGVATLPVGGGDACEPSPALPFGRYRVTAWRGFEHEYASAEVTLAPGQRRGADPAPRAGVARRRRAGRRSPRPCRAVQRLRRARHAARDGPGVRRPGGDRAVGSRLERRSHRGHRRRRPRGRFGLGAVQRAGLRRRSRRRLPDAGHPRRAARRQPEPRDPGLVVGADAPGLGPRAARATAHPDQPPAVPGLLAVRHHRLERRVLAAAVPPRLRRRRGAGGPHRPQPAGRSPHRRQPARLLHAVRPTALG
jgi:hypothetical protein